MFKFALFLAVAFGLLVSQGIAAPTTYSSIGTVTRGTRYSFSAWTNSIIANPATALSPGEAVKAFLDSLKKSPGVELVFATTNYSREIFYETHWTPDISAQQLSSTAFVTLGDVPCHVSHKTTNTSGLNKGVNFARDLLIYDLLDTVMLMPTEVGAESWDPNQRGTCRNIARTAAAVIDKCTQLNGAVVGMADFDVTGEKVGVFVLRNPGGFVWP